MSDLAAPGYSWGFGAGLFSLDNSASSFGSSLLLTLNSLHSLLRLYCLLCSHNKRNKKSSKLGAYSMKLKDVVRNSSRGGSRISRRVESKLVNFVDMDQNSPGASLNSTSVEIEKTIRLGLDVGFQMDNFKEDLRTIIEGEGVAKLFK
ncbi:hypothetical protein L2E82_10268 [Cichorium intybus]|uniref:Uncharacterized protein n=1 Tax=Cichorium intybus TaxID=13427 RepID=A0ACB9GA08_CICIN|nr:hypothetical protein L2E82_10268 [Cichorium intybus]